MPLRFKQLIVTFKDARLSSVMPRTPDEKLNQLLYFIPPPAQHPYRSRPNRRRAGEINQHTTSVTCFQAKPARDQLQTLWPQPFQFTRFSTEVSQLVNAIEKRNEAVKRLCHTPVSVGVG